MKKRSSSLGSSSSPASGESCLLSTDEWHLLHALALQERSFIDHPISCLVEHTLLHTSKRNVQSCAQPCPAALLACTITASPAQPSMKTQIRWSAGHTTSSSGHVSSKQSVAGVNSNHATQATQPDTHLGRRTREHQGLGMGLPLLLP